MKYSSPFYTQRQIPTPKLILVYPRQGSLHRIRINFPLTIHLQILQRNMDNFNLSCEEAKDTTHHAEPSLPVEPTSLAMWTNRK